MIFLEKYKRILAAYTGLLLITTRRSPTIWKVRIFEVVNVYAQATDANVPGHFAGIYETGFVFFFERF